MAVALTDFPYTEEVNYYENGIFRNKLYLSLDPVDTPIEFTFQSTTTGVIFPPYFSMEVLFYDNTTPGVVAPDTFLPIPILEGDTISIRGELFTAKTNPQANEFFTCPQGSSATGADFLARKRSAESLADAINQNLNLSPLYFAIPIFATFTAPNANANVFGVKIVSRYTGFFYNLIPGSNVTQGIVIVFNGLTTTSTVKSIGATINSVNYNFGEGLSSFDYGVFVEVWEYRGFSNYWGRRPNNDNSNLIGVLELPYRYDNLYTFDISKLLKASVKTNLPNRVLVVNDTGKLYFDQGAPTAVKSYYLKYGDKFSGGVDTTGAPLLDPSNSYIRKYYSNQNERVALRWASPGAYKLNISQDTPQHPPYWYHVRPINLTETEYAPIKRLTNEPEYKLRRRYESPEIIYFYIHNDENKQTNRHYRIKSTYYGASNLFQNITISHITLLQNASGLFWCDLDLQKINFPATDNANRILYSEHVLQYSDTTTANASFVDYSQPWTYSWDLNYEPTKIAINKSKYFKVYWKSPYGVYDQFEFEGFIIQQINSSFVDYQKSYTDTNYNLEENTKSGINSRFKSNIIYEIKIDTGYIDITHMDWLSELIKSNEWYTDSSFQFWNLNNELQTKKNWESLLLTAYEFTEDINTKQFNLNCTFQYSIPENTITN